MSGLAPIFPFVMVLGLQLGAPIAVLGAMGTVILAVPLVIHPLVIYLLEISSTVRRGIFVANVLLICLSLTSMAFIPPFGKPPEYSEAWLVAKNLTKWKDEDTINKHIADNVNDSKLEMEQYSIMQMNNAIFFDHPSTDIKSATKLYETWENTVLVIPRNGKKLFSNWTQYNF